MRCIILRIRDDRTISSILTLYRPQNKGSMILYILSWNSFVCVNGIELNNLCTNLTVLKHGWDFIMHIWRLIVTSFANYGTIGCLLYNVFNIKIIIITYYSNSSRHVSFELIEDLPQDWAALVSLYYRFCRYPRYLLIYNKIPPLKVINTQQCW